jgi:response regulator RpfG family c-di-GMP phosphodiesterase
MKTNFDANILVVDDEMGPRESIKMILKPFFNVYTAENGQQALKIIHEVPIDLATLDFKMPGISGTELLKEIRKFDNEISVVMITGYGTMKSAVEGIRFGASDYLVKPFEINEIIDVVRKNIGHKKSKSEVKQLVQDMGKVMGLPISTNDISKLGTMRAYILNKLEVCFSGFNSRYSSKEAAIISSLKDLINAAESQSSESDHSLKVAYFANLLGKRAGLERETLEHLEIAAWLHDIGILGTYYRFLDYEKNTQPDLSNYANQKAELGGRFCKVLNLPDPVIAGITHQYEAFNGDGLPGHLSGEDIPVISRIIYIAEQVDELFRKYPQGARLVVEQLKEKDGKELDPELVHYMSEIILGNKAFT